MAHAAGFTVVPGSQFPLPIHTRITSEVDFTVALLVALAEALFVVAVLTRAHLAVISFVTPGSLPFARALAVVVPVAFAVIAVSVALALAVAAPRAASSSVPVA